MQFVGLVALSSSPAPDLWSWITSTNIETYLTGGGALTLAALFATNRILTIGQHRSRIEDLQQYHAEAIAEKDKNHAAILATLEQRYAEMRESRDYYRGARLEEKDRADKATGQLVEMSEIAQTTVAALTALERTAQAVKQ